MAALSRQVNSSALLRRAGLRSSAGARNISVSPALKLLAFVLFLPDELSIEVFQFRFTLVRLVLFFLIPAFVVRMAQRLASRGNHFVVSDALIGLTAGWMIISPAILFDLEYALHHGGFPMVEFCGSYFAARLLLSRRGQALRFINLMCYIVAAVALIGALDALTSSPITHNLASQLTGINFRLQDEYRLGIFRAAGPIIHPELFGITCAIGLLIAVAVPIEAKTFVIGACGLGVFLSLSSGPIEAAVLGLFLVTYNRILRSFRGRWLLLFSTGALTYGSLFLVTGSPLDSIFNRVMLDPSSYWIRLIQWDVDVDFILKSPWLGYGFEWSDLVKGLAQTMGIPSLLSVDNLWLNLALQYGIPGAVLIALSMMSSATGRAAYLTENESKLATALSIIIVVIILFGFTVHIWEATWIFVALLLGVRAHLTELGSRPFFKSNTAEQPPPTFRLRRSQSAALPMQLVNRSAR